MSLLYLLMGSATGLSPTPKLGLGKQNSLPSWLAPSQVAFGFLFQKAALAFHEPLPGVLKYKRMILVDCFGLLWT